LAAPLTAVEGQGCPLCEAPLAERRLREVTGDEAPMRLVLRNLPVLSCEAPHRYFPEQGFAVWLLKALVEAELAKIPAGVEKGMVFRKYACGGCGAPLPADGGEPWTFSSTLAWKDAPGFVVDVTVPVVQCPACGRDQARSATELAKLLPSALVHAFKDAGIKAPG
jgi:hypothetical protein